MKNRIEDIIKDAYEPEIENIGFLTLSGTLGQIFFDTPKQKRKIEDYGRLMGICIVFGFRRILLKLCKEGESILEEVLNYLREEGKKPLAVEGWINEAIENILDPQLKNIAIELWEGKKQQISEKNLTLRKCYNLLHFIRISNFVAVFIPRQWR